MNKDHVYLIQRHKDLVYLTQRSKDFFFLTQMHKDLVFPDQKNRGLSLLTVYPVQMNRDHAFLVRMNMGPSYPSPFLSFLNQKSKDPFCLDQTSRDCVFLNQRSMGFVFLIQMNRDLFCRARSHKDHVYGPYQMHMLHYVFLVQRNMGCACLFLHHLAECHGNSALMPPLLHRLCASLLLLFELPPRETLA